MILEIIQEASDTLLADPYFSNVPVVSEDLGDPQNQIDTYLMKTGCGVLLMTPKASVRFPDKPGPYYDDIMFIAAVFENVKLNRASTGTRKNALDIAEHVATILHMHSPINIAESITCQSPTIVLVPDPMYLAYNCLFRTQGGTQYTIPVIATPTVGIVDNGNGTKTVTIACATPNVSIYYTTDTTYPSPRDATGGTQNPLYTAPVILAINTPLRIRCWLAGYKPSAVVQVTGNA